MPVDKDLLEKAIGAPQNLWFEEAQKLAEQLGWEPVGGSGSHNVYRHAGATKIRGKFPRPLNLQRGSNGKAKAYQVEQLIEMARAMGLIPKTEE